MKPNLVKQTIESSLAEGTNLHLSSRRLKAGLATFAIVGLTVGTTNAQLAPGKATGQQLSDEAAVLAILNPQAANALRPKDAAFLQQEALAAFVILNPDIANRERRKDPAVVEKEKRASFAIINAKALEAERRKDPILRKAEEEAFRLLIKR